MPDWIFAFPAAELRLDSYWYLCDENEVNAISQNPFHWAMMAVSVLSETALQEVKRSMSKKKGAKGMPIEGPGKHDPSKPRKNKAYSPVYGETKSGIKSEQPRKTRI